MSDTLLFVQAFAREMESKLAANAHKGNAEGWRRLPEAHLLAMLRAEVAELELALHERARMTGFSRVEAEGEVTREAADVANIAMMIADLSGDLCLHVDAASSEP